MNTTTLRQSILDIEKPRTTEYNKGYTDAIHDCAELALGEKDAIILLTGVVNRIKLLVDDKQLEEAIQKSLDLADSYMRG